MKVKLNLENKYLEIMSIQTRTLYCEAGTTCSLYQIILLYWRPTVSNPTDLEQLEKKWKEDYELRSLNHRFLKENNQG